MPSIRKSLAGVGCILALATWGFHELAFLRITPTYPLPSGEIIALHPNYMTGCGKAELFARLGVDEAKDQQAYCDEVLGSAGIRGAVHLRWMVFAAGVLASLLLFACALIALRIEKSAPKVVRGPVRLTGRKAYAAIRKTSRKEIRQTGAGIDFPPGLAMSRDRESRHCLISGSVGSGKTQTIQHMILEAMRWGDKMLILDTKGDMTERLPGEITLIAPQDKRSAVWDISADCVTKQDARELAARFIPKSSDPMWAEAARELLVACIVSLQHEMPATWSWGDLHARALLGADELKGMALVHHPAAAQMIGEPLRTVSGLLGHSELQTTAGYAQFAEAPVRQAAERVAEHLERTLSQRAPKAMPEPPPMVAAFLAQSLSVREFAAQQGLSFSTLRQKVGAYNRARRETTTEMEAS